MPVTVVVGGQYGSEGKGKVAHRFAADQQAAAVIRVGGPNSGHTSVGAGHGRQVLQQLPMAAFLDGVACLIGPGSYVDPVLLLEEIARFDLESARVCVDYRAMVVSEGDREQERGSGLGERIGSTCSGTGAAVARRVARGGHDDLAVAAEELRPYVGDAVARARALLGEGRRVVVEGTQGFGLSLLQSPHYPYVTSRDTTAAGAVSEAGLSPLDVDEVVLVLRAHPIRVAGDSGPFDAEEIDWETVAREGGLTAPPEELSSVTQRVRRVARFEPTIVTKAIQANRPSRIVLNHLDYVDGRCAGGKLTARARDFVAAIETGIGRPVDLLGVGPEPGDLVKAERSLATPAR